MTISQPTAASRRAALVQLGATPAATWHELPGMTAARRGGVLYLALDHECSQDDWMTALDLASRYGYQGDGHSDATDLDGMTVWKMPVPAPREPGVLIPVWTAEPGRDELN